MTFCLTQDPPDSTHQVAFSLHPEAAFRAWVSACLTTRRPVTTFLLRLLDLHISTVQAIQRTLRNRLRTAESTTRIPTEEPVTAVSLCTAKSISFDPLGDAVLTHGFDEGSYIVDECVEPPDLYITRPPTFVHIDLDQEFRPPTMPRVSKHAWEVIYRNTSQTDLPRKPLLASVTLFLVARSPNE